MNCLCEALGMALPGNGTILAVSKEREALYRLAARQIVKLVETDLKPRDIATLEAFDNALALDVAMGGSTNTVLHTLAIAREAGLAYDIGRIDAISRRVPCLCKVAPSSDYHVQDVHRAGGVHTILGELKRLDEANGYQNDRYTGRGAPKAPRILSQACRTVTGKTLGENIAEWDVRSKDCAAVARTVCVSGAAVVAADPADRLGQAGLSAGGNLAPKSMLFFPGDERALLLWRFAAAWNSGELEALMPLFTEDAQLQVEPAVMCKGAAAIHAALERKLKEARGLVRAELATLKKTPVLLLWHYAKGEARQRQSLFRVAKFRHG
jgi:dihydroxy-acid dehydratase